MHKIQLCLALIIVLAHYALCQNPIEELIRNKCFLKVYDDGLKCVTDISPDFDINKVENFEFGIENLEKRCCSLHVFYDCFVKNGKVKQ